MADASNLYEAFTNLLMRDAGRDPNEKLVVKNMTANFVGKEFTTTATMAGSTMLELTAARNSEAFQQYPAGQAAIDRLIGTIGDVMERLGKQL